MLRKHFCENKIYLKGRKDYKGKKCEIKECKRVAEKVMKRGIKECELTNCFQECRINCDPSIFREMRKQKLRGFI